MTDTATNTTATNTTDIRKIKKSPGFWRESWQRFRRRRLSMLALSVVILLGVVAVFAPMIVGTKPIVCSYQGKLYFPFLGYFDARFESEFAGAPFFKRYPLPLKENDPKSWAVWPLNYNDPVRSVAQDEFPNRPANPQSSPPTRLNWFGTDSRGFDVFAQIVHGTRTALLVGFVSMGIAAMIGITLGAIAGYFGRWIDMAVSRLIEIVLCVPTLILILALIAVIPKPTIWHMMAVIGVTGWTGIARLTRAEFLKLKQMDYVAAAKSMGVGHFGIISRYLLPNALAPVLVPITFGIASAVLIETALSYIGFGAPPPNPSWGQLLRSGQSNYQNWWLILFPGVGIFIAVLSYNLIGEGLQNATDPRLREGGRS